MADLVRSAPAIEPLESRILMSITLPDATDCSMAYDATGVLHVAYFNDASKQLMYTTENAAGTWSTPTTIAPLTADAGGQISLQVSPQGITAVAYYCPSQEHLDFAQLVGTSWQASVVNVKGNTGLNPSLSFLKDGTPVVSSYNASPAAASRSAN